jgi:lipoprotein NlpI
VARDPGCEGEGGVAREPCGEMLRRLKVIFHYSKADAALRRGNFDRAADHLSKVIQVAPNNAAAYNDRGVARQGMGDYRGAIDDFNKAIAIAPDMPKAYGGRGISWKFLGDFDRAIADHAKAIAVHPDLADAHGELGVVHLCKHDFHDAISSLTTAINLAPNDPNHLKQRGIAFFCQGDFKAAIADLQRAFDIANDTYALLFLHLSRVKAGANASAALEADAGRLRTWQWPSAVVGLFLERLSADSTIAAASTPDELAEVRFYLGQWHLLHGDRAEARKALQAAAQTCPPWFTEHIAATAELRRLD